MAYDKDKQGALLDQLNWLIDDLQVLKDRVRSGDEDRVRGKARDFLNSFDDRFKNRL